jgi:hypothetical protein
VPPSRPSHSPALQAPEQRDEVGDLVRGDCETGAAYLFTRTLAGWQQTGELTATDAASGTWFGSSVAITADGNTALTGAPYHDSATGAVYLFAQPPWW